MTKSRTVWFGWVTFAAVMLVVLGLLNVLEGLVALLQNQVAFIDGDSLVVVNLTGWGILMLAFGGLLLAAGIGLLARNVVARVAAIVIVALHMLIQVGSLGAYPVWSLLMITLSVVVLFALTVHWSDAFPPTVAPATAAAPSSHRADREYQPADYQGYGSGIPMNSPTSPGHAGARPSAAPAQNPQNVQNVGPYPAGRPGSTARPNDGAHAAEPGRPNDGAHSAETGRYGDMAAPGEAPQPPRYGDMAAPGEAPQPPRYGDIGGTGAHSRSDETAQWSSDQPRHAAPTSDYGVI
jgi:hypothetical protein